MKEFQPEQFGKYLLLDKIAVGGMAELYRAKIIGVQGFEKLIAVKMILPHLSFEEELVQSFINEAKLAAFLQHRNIVQIYDFGRMEGRYFIAMEYLFGKDLKSVIKKSEEKKRPIGLENSLFIISQICKGLDYAHNLKDFNGRPLSIIHRDIGPQNIFITYDGEIKIIDFGIAKAAIQDRTTQSGAIKGKIAYMSPEQAEGSAIDHRSDLYAIGIILYELVLQKRMFSGDAYEIFAKVRESDFEAPETVNRDLPTRLYEILDKALARDPGMRYQSGGDMLGDLEAFMAEQSYRPNELGISAYMKEILRVEADAEITAMQEAAQSKAIAESFETVAPDTTISLQKTLLLPREAMTAKRNKRTGVLYSLAASVVVIIIVVLGFQYLKDRVPEINAMISSPLKMHALSDTNRTQPEQTDVIITPDPYLKSVMEAEELLQNGDFEAATILFEGLLQKEPGIKDRIASSYSMALLGLSVRLSETDPDKAREMVMKALEIDPDNVEGYLEIGLYYTKEKKFTKAVESYEKAVRLDPNIPKAYFNLGYVFAELKDYLKAEEMYMNAVRLSPAFLDEALFNLAVIQRRLGKTDQCINNLQEALRVNPDNEIVRKYLARITQGK